MGYTVMLLNYLTWSEKVINGICNVSVIDIMLLSIVEFSADTARNTPYPNISHAVTYPLKIAMCFKSVSFKHHDVE